MAHAEQLLFVKIASHHIAPDGFKDRAVLELGSYNVNGSVRPYFSESTYVGVDLIPGPGVDIVHQAHDLDHPDETYDLTISCECFEHNPEWSATLLNMYRMTKPGGIVLFTCATRGRLEHGTKRTSPKSSPGTQEMGWDYYQNLVEPDFRRKIDFDSFFDQYDFLINRNSKDIYFIGKKKGNIDTFCLNTALLNSAYVEANQILQRNKPLVMKATRFLDNTMACLALLPDHPYHSILVHYHLAKRAFGYFIGGALRPTQKLRQIHKRPLS